RPRAERAAVLVLAMDALAFFHVLAFLGTERSLGLEVDAPRPAMVVVDRNPDVAAQRVLAEGRDQREPREQPLRDAPVVRIGFAVAAAVQREAEVGLLDV